ncbi:MAG: peptidoglycan DD-metalloendopeptidase family protein [candidate division Zixibacteria bacterium]|nr:peptidoglycan DD-metalloendopeptidase family protein [candidate division Zixibacteria bacterium]
MGGAMGRVRRLCWIPQGQEHGISLWKLIMYKSNINTILFILSAFAVIAIGGLALNSFAQQDEEDISEQLNRIRDEIESKRVRLKSLARDEKSVLGNLRSLEQNIDLTNAFIRKLDNTSSLILNQIEILGKRIDSTSVELSKAREQFYRHLETFYKRNRGRPLTAHLLSGELSDGIRRYYLSKSIIEYDNNLVENIREMIENIEENKARLAKNREDLSAVKKERYREKQFLARKKSQRQVLLDRVRNEKKLQLEAIAQLEREATELEQLMEDLRAARDSGEKEIPDTKTAFYRFRRSLPWPVQGNILMHYGDIVHPVYKTKTFNPGIDISAPYGTEVKAVADGTVAYTGYLRGYGNFVILEHGEGYFSLYARLSEIKVKTGDGVLKGDAIAFVGDAGEGGNPSLHFEMRRGKKSYNPLEWLR